MSEVIGFDWDGTLVMSWTADPLPSVRARLAALPVNTRTFIATNQAGPAFRSVLGDAKYPTVEDVMQRITDGLAALAWRPTLLLICWCAAKDGAMWWRAEQSAATEFDRQLRALPGRVECRTYIMPHYRKPQPGMLLAGLRDLGGNAGTYVGDMETDRQAAEAARMGYIDAAEWRRASRLARMD